MTDPFNPGATQSVPANSGLNPAAQLVNGAAQASAQVSSEPQEIIDINDPRLTSEVLVNSEGDAYAQPAPPPAGRYRVKLKLEGVKDASGQVINYEPKAHRNRAGVVDQVYLSTAISATIIDPRFPQYEGVVVFDSWVSTFQGRDGSTKIATILGRLTRPDGSAWNTKGEKINQLAWMERFVKALSGEPEAGVDLDWEWSCQGCGEAAKASGQKYPQSITGMNKFPQDAKTKQAVPEMLCQVNRGHGYSRARTRIVAVVGVGDIK